MSLETYVGIDPGSERSAYAMLTYSSDDTVVEGYHFTLYAFGKIHNPDLEQRLRGWSREKQGDSHRLAIEEMKSFGRAVGTSIFVSCYWSGRFAAAWDIAHRTGGKFAPRSTIKACLTGAAKTTDAHVRQAIIQRFPQTGTSTKGEPCAIGCKKPPGPLYGVTADCWSAIAVAITAREKWASLKNLPT